MAPCSGKTNLALRQVPLFTEQTCRIQPYILHEKYSLLSLNLLWLSIIEWSHIKVWQEKGEEICQFTMLQSFTKFDYILFRSNFNHVTVQESPGFFSYENFSDPFTTVSAPFCPCCKSFTFEKYLWIKWTWWVNICSLFLFIFIFLPSKVILHFLFCWFVGFGICLLYSLYSPCILFNFYH